MTIKLENGTARVPLWAVIVLVVSIIIGGAGWVIAAEAKVSDAQHALLKQEISEVDARGLRNTVRNEAQDEREIELATTIASIQSDLKAIKEGQDRIMKRLGL